MRLRQAGLAEAAFITAAATMSGTAAATVMSTLTVTADGGTVPFDDATVRSPDLVASSGIVHVIERPVVPEGGSGPVAWARVRRPSLNGLRRGGLREGDTSMVLDGRQGLLPDSNCERNHAHNRGAVRGAPPAN